MASKESEISKITSAVKKEEHKLVGEVKQEGRAVGWFFKSDTFKVLLLIILFAVLISGVLYLQNSSKRVYIEKSEISAPIISLSSPVSGVLQKVFVKEGDFVYEGMAVAQVDTTLIRAKIDGQVLYVQNTPGQIVNTQIAIVKMANPEEFKVIGHVLEDKGLSEIKVGQKVIFTVDTFGSKEYNGTVDSISPTSRDSAITFSISDKRPEKEFDVKVKYNTNLYPELKNGMSAKMWIYK